MTFDDPINFTKCFSIIKEYISSIIRYIWCLEGRKYSLLAEGAFFVNFDMVQLERQHSPAGTYNLAEH